MLANFHRMMRRVLWPKRRQRNCRGQVSIVLILVSAVGLLLYTYALNLGRTSGVKTRTMIAAETAAALTSSFVAGTAEQLSQEYLKGSDKLCDSSSWVATLIKLVILVVLLIAMIVITALTGGATLPLVVAVGLGIAAAFTAGSLVLQIVVIQPKIQDMWNEMMANAFPSIEDRVVEMGVQAALTSIVDDPVEIPDVFDRDGDGRYAMLRGGVLQAPAGETPPTVSRFAYYYTNRLNSVANPQQENFTEFRDRLTEFVYAEQGDWGLSDRLDCDGYADVACCQPIDEPDIPAVCDPCCQADASLRPSGCPAELAEIVARCGRNSYLGEAYPFLYESFYEDPFNNASGWDGAGAPPVVSFREQLGRDDIAGAFRVNNQEPRWYSGLPTIADSQQAADVPPAPGFRLQDATGFYDGDDQRGMFPFFYLARDMAPVPADPAVQPAAESLECFWWNQSEQACDPGVLPGGALVPFDPGMVIDDAAVLTYAGLPVTTPDGATLRVVDYAGGNSVYDLPPSLADSTRDIVIDNIRDSVDIGGAETLRDALFFAGQDVCGVEAAMPKPNEYDILDAVDWAGIKPGAGTICSSAVPALTPYDEACPKHRDDAGTLVKCTTEPVEFSYVDDATGALVTEDRNLARLCTCTDAGIDRSLWPDDILDAMYERINEFLWTYNTIQNTFNKMGPATGFSAWYDLIADWIEPACDNTVPACDDTTDPDYHQRCCSESFTKEDRWGHLWVFREHLRELFWIVDSWVRETAADLGVRQGCNVWCVPDATCSGLSAEEAALFEPGEYEGVGEVVVPDGRTRGDVTEVLECLSWSVEASIEDPDDPDDQLENDAGDPYLGVKGRYEACLEKGIGCDDLPRPLVSGKLFGGAEDRLPPAFAPNPLDLTTASGECKSAGDLSTCQTECSVSMDESYIPAVGDYSAVIEARDQNCCSEDGDPTWSQDVPTITGGPLHVSCDLNLSTEDIANAMLGSCAWTEGGDYWIYDDEGNIVRLESEDNEEYQAWLKANIAAFEVFSAKLQARRSFLEEFVNKAETVRRQLAEAVDRISEFLDNGTPIGTAVRDDDHNTVADGPVVRGSIDHDGFLTESLGLPYNRFVPLYDEDGHVAGPYDTTGTDSPAEMIIRTRQGLRGGATSNFAIYVWRGESSDPDWSDGKVTQTSGLLHAVKVESQVPMRCANCTLNGMGGKKWPSVETSSSGFMDSETCYYLVNHFGMTKARVIRFDQRPNLPSAGSLFSRIPFFRPTGAHPDFSSRNVTGGGLFNTVNNRCLVHIDPILIDMSAALPEQSPQLLEAFMINEPPRLDDGTFDRDFTTDAGQCWNDVHDYILRYGIHSESCVGYYWGKKKGGASAAGDERGMRMRFTKCDQAFAEGW